MKTLPKLKKIAVACLFGIALTSKATLLHEYTFDPSDPYADSVGNSDLVVSGSVGQITMNSGGYASFSGDTAANGNGVYLSSDAPISSYSPFLLSIWFRIPTIEQESYASIFSTANTSDDGWQINFLNGYLSINKKAANNATVPIIRTTDISTNEWHLITVLQDPDADQQGQVWMDGTLYSSTNISFGTRGEFRLGINRKGRSEFKGDIALVRISGGEEETWDDTKQSDAYNDPPAVPTVPEPAVASLILLSSFSFIGLRRFFS